MTHHDGRPDAPREETRAPRSQPQGQGWPPPDDEISLFDLWDSLVRRRWLIVGVAAVIAALVGAYAMIRADVYRYQSSLRIGYTVVEGKEGQAQREPLSTPGSLRDLLAANDIHRVDVASSEESDIVHLRIEGAETEAQRHVQDLRTAAQTLLSDHADILKVERMRATARMEQLDRAQDRVESRLADTRQRLDRIAEIDDGNESVAAYRIDSLQERVGELQDRLLEIEMERDRVNTYRTTIDDYMGLFTDNFESGDLAEQRQAADRIQAMSEGIRPTTMLSPANRSRTTVGSSDTLILALGLIFGGMLGIFTGFIAEFLAAAHRRHHDTGTGEAFENRN